MNTPVPPVRRSVRALLSAVLTALAIPLVLAAGAALPTTAIVAGIVLAVFVGSVVRTLAWVAGTPGGAAATVLALHAALGAGAAVVVLGVLAVLAGPVALLAIPLFTAVGVAAWWVGTGDPGPAGRAG
ncbi:hypothetical protein [Pseudonocardia sp. HH130630-07]|uniref:hypothetical protein n=1 Tax=Pseudonocardia sp. HH130630-07 TaxID=1690815 RepID=UPI000814CEC1|nr:hypothetical protein [Pseudonocardia sp. HH130630-07]ANY06838.1 hypothetical protein AFB00_11650 [Pseudonocardia sp. HH130630-07]